MAPPLSVPESQCRNGASLFSGIVSWPVTLGELSSDVFAQRSVRGLAPLLSRIARRQQLHLEVVPVDNLHRDCAGRKALGGAASIGPGTHPLPPRDPLA
jgi:hypothetical protein